jgi:hypothetical protein
MLLVEKDLHGELSISCTGSHAGTVEFFIFLFFIFNCSRLPTSAGGKQGCQVPILFLSCPVCSCMCSAVEQGTASRSVAARQIPALAETPLRNQPGDSDSNQRVEQASKHPPPSF